jgi:hypothetical protein
MKNPHWCTDTGIGIEMHGLTRPNMFYRVLITRNLDTLPFDDNNSHVTQE